MLVIDEAAFFRQDVKKLVYEVAKPAVADYNGTICMISTTSDLLNTFYYDVTTGKEPGWACFEWTAYDNPYMATQWDEEIQEMKRVNPLITETPMYKRMYENQWVINSDATVYKFNADRNLIDELPDEKWNYVLGIDLGYSPDPSAFVVCAYTKHDPNLYIVETYKKIEMDLTDVANKIHELDRKYGFETMVIDNETTYIGTFNLDPRSINLNTEVGVIIRDTKIARQVEQAISRDMSELNSWDLRDVNANKMASWRKRIKLFFYRLLPMDAVL